jgi:hypothetical protein
MLQSDNAKLLILQSNKSKNSWLWVLFGGRRASRPIPSNFQEAHDGSDYFERSAQIELELELIQTQMTQKPMLRAEVYARALRASQNRKEDSV